MNKNNFLGKELVFYGRWKEKPLTVSYWVSNEKSGKSEYKEYIKFIQDYIYIDGNYYVFKDQTINLNNSIKKILETNLKIFIKLFSDIENLFERFNKLKSGKKDPNNLLKFLDLNKEMYFFWNILSGLNVGITDYLNNKFNKINYLDYILMPKETILMKEGREFKRLFILFVNKDKGFEDAINSYLDEYGFVGTHCYLGTPQTKKSVMERLRHFKLEKKEDRKIKEDDFFKTNKELFEIVSYVAYYKMYIVELYDKISYLFWPLLESIGKKYDLSFEQITHYTFQELKDLILNGKLVNKDIIEKRWKIYGLVNDNGVLRFLGDEEINELIKSLVRQEHIDLKGNTAFKGFARGVAKIILDPKELNKINKGDILVTFETTPDYMVAIHRAKAIITEQGGITSHAAIVSRELRKPCIVGVKGITRVLKDGDLVEVDTTNGFIKILKRK